MQTTTEKAAGFSLSSLDAFRSCAKMKPVVVLKKIDPRTLKSWNRRGTEELSDNETSEYDKEEEFEDETETKSTEENSYIISTPFSPEVVEHLDAPVLFERGEKEEVGREPMGRLEDPDAPVLVEDNALEEAGRREHEDTGQPEAPVLVEDNAPAFGMADIEAAFYNHDNLFATDEGYESGGLYTCYATEEEEEMINGELTSSSSESDDEYVPEGNVNIIPLPVDRPRRRRM